MIEFNEADYESWREEEAIEAMGGDNLTKGLER